ncbi:MAG: GNAT family N-acetyltransferase [Euryarchaeota archaeon]|nr:GNAT family N-acetyltransferase [Euryarchaeota archaeon]
MPSAPKTTVRVAQPEDLETLVRFVKGVAKESEGRDLDDETVRRGLRSALGSPSSVATYLMAERDCVPVGCLMLTKEWSDWTAAWYWWIQSVYVTPAQRGSGVLDALYDELKRRAKAADVKSLRLYVESDNKTAIAAYERLGMTPAPYRVFSDDL